MKYFSTLLVLALTTRSDKALAQSVPKFGLPAGFRGTISTDGNMFEIAAKDQPVLIERLDINMGEGTEPVEVYYRPGHVNYTYDDSYKLIFGGNITSAGKGLATPLPPFTSPVLVTPGTSVTFYVTIANRYGANLWYSIGVGSGTTYASDENIDIIEGYASGYPWTGYALDRQWNGVVYYSPSFLPTFQPSPRPSSLPTTNPSLSPSYKPSSRPSYGPTSDPSLSPSSRPSFKPTSSPSSSPTFQPSPRPSSLPTTNPSLSPSYKPSSRPSYGPTSNPSLSPSSRPSSKPTSKPSPSSSPSSSPTSQSALAQSVSAGFRGTISTDGNMFEIAAKDQPVLIERLDINMGEGTEPVEVYYRPGHVNYTYDDSYKLIFGGNITSAGKGLATPLPPFTSPVLVTPGTSVTFYVTIANRYGANLWYSIGVGSGTTYASDENIDIIEGYASLYPWTGQVAYDRQWNGVVYYSLQTNSSPTASPTKIPTASPVTSPPSVGNPNPTASPVATQTGSPTIIEVEVENRPSSQPTISPSSFPSNQPSSRLISQLTISPSSLPSSQPSPRPSSLPTSTSSPSSSPISQPSEPPTRAPTNKPTTTETDDLESPTKSPTPIPMLSPTLLTSVPSLSPTVHDDDDFWFPNPFPSSSASFNRFNFMGWICSSSFPLLFITFFVL